MSGKKRHVDPIPESFSSPEEAGEFWDTHDLGDYWDLTVPVDDMVFDIKRRRYWVSLEASLSQRLGEVASQSGVTAETLVNLWVKEKLEKYAPEPVAHRTKREKQKHKTA